MMKRPLFTAGLVCLAATAVSFYVQKPLLLALPFLILALIFAVKSKQPLRLIFLCLMAAASCGAVELWNGDREDLRALAGETVVLEGLVTKAETYDTAIRYEAHVGDFSLTLWSYHMDALEPGQRFRALVTLEEQEERCQYSSILSGNVQTMEDLGPDKSLTASFLRLRNELISRIEARFHGAGREVLLGFLLGEKADLSAKTEKVFRNSGSLHLLTVSGFHLSMMISGIYAFLWIFQIDVRSRAALTLPFILFLVLLEGSTVSILRAAIMSAYPLVAMVFQQDSDPLDGWGLAALLILLNDPAALFSHSFLLSFSATLGILLVDPILYHLYMDVVPLPKAYTLRRWLVYNALATACASLSANLLTAPFLLYFYGSWPLISILSSIVIFPLMPWIMGLGVASILLPWDFLYKITQLLTGVLYRILQSLAELDWNIYSQSWAAIGGFLLLYLLIFLLWKIKADRQQAGLSITAYTAMFMLFLAAEPQSLQLIGTRTALVLTEQGHAAVIGTVERESDVEELSQLLRGCGVEQVDLLCLTTEPSHGGIYARTFTEEWTPAHIFSPSPVEAFDLTATPYRSGAEQTIRFWEDWMLSLTEDGAILSDGTRKVLKINEKYDIIKYMSENDLIFGDDWLAWSDEAQNWSKTPAGQLKLTLED